MQLRKLGKQERIKNKGGAVERQITYQIET